MEKTMKEIMIDIIENFNKSNVIDDAAANEAKKLININTNYMIKSFQKAYEITPIALDDFEVEKYYIDLCNDVLCAIETNANKKCYPILFVNICEYCAISNILIELRT